MIHSLGLRPRVDEDRPFPDPCLQDTEHGNDRSGSSSWPCSTRLRQAGSLRPLSLEDAFMVGPDAEVLIGELQLVRNDDGDQSIAWQEATAMRTFNGMTDAVLLGRLNVLGRLLSIADGGSHLAAAGIDMPLHASPGDLTLPRRTWCPVHLVGLMRLLPQWPVQR